MPTGWHSQGRRVLASHRSQAVSRTDCRLEAYVCEAFQILKAPFAGLDFDWGVSESGAVDKQ